MSLLGTPVYANPATAFWVSSAGDTIDGNLVVNGTLDVTGSVELTGPQVEIDGQLVMYGPNAKISFSEVGVGQGLDIRSDATQTNGFISTDGSLYLGRSLAGTSANTVFTPSAATTNADLLTLGGQILTAAGGGITPKVSSTALTNVPVGVPTSLAPTPTLPIVSGQTYDIQITGYFEIPLGTTPAPLDKMEILTSVGPGVAPTFYAHTVVSDWYPGWAEDPWVAGSFRPISIRARLPANANLANIVITANLTGTGVYLPTGIDVVLTQVSVVRVA